MVKGVKTDSLTENSNLFVYLLMIGIAVVAMIWTLEEHYKVILMYDRLGYVTSIVVALFCLLLVRFFALANLAKVLLFGYISLYLISLTIASYISSAHTGDIYSFASTLQWVPILYLVAFLFLPVKQAILSSIAIYVLLVTLLLLTYLGFIETKSPSLEALALNISLTHAVYLFCMIGVMRLKQTQKDSQLKALQMEHAANNDGLLGIGNRRLLQSELNARVAKNTPFSLLLIDIDFFKAINDIHGHLVGDDTLREICQCMSDNLRPQDTIGRWGGEEFLVIANGAKFDTAVNLAERLRSAVESYAFSTVGRVTISIGVAQFHENTSVSQTFAEADKALYKAKGSGRNQVVAAA
jgi:diguanylate cyclase (GGDEF)-like protein